MQGHHGSRLSFVEAPLAGLTVRPNSAATWDVSRNIGQAKRSRPVSRPRSALAESHDIDLIGLLTPLRGRVQHRADLPTLRSVLVKSLQVCICRLRSQLTAALNGTLKTSDAL